MLAKMTNAVFNPATGRVNVTLSTSTAPGYPNTCEQYQSWGIISVPLPGQMVSINQQSLAQVYATGYNNQITDSNFSMNPGETVVYAKNWYFQNALTGVFAQPVGTLNKENMMMGQSTNQVLIDILQMIINITEYLAGHTHSGVSGGTSTSGPPSSAPPDDSTMVADNTYISANQNLAITGVYTPK